MASMQVRRLRRSPEAALGPGGGAGSREQPFLRAPACVARRGAKSGAEGGTSRAEVQGVEVPGGGAGEGRWRRGRAGMEVRRAEV